MVNTIIGDSVGLYLEPLSLKSRDEVLLKHIRHTKAKLPVVHYTDTTEIMLEAMCAFSAGEVYCPGGDFPVNQVLGLAFATGYHTALQQLDYDAWSNLTVQAYNDTENEDRDFYVYCSISYLIWALTSDGYFRSKHLQHLVKENLANHELARALNYLLRHRFDKQFLFQKSPEPTTFDGLTYLERVFIKVCFYMLRVSSGWFKKPRFMIEDIAKHETLDLSDVLGVFSALCSVSEHLYLLYTKPLQDQMYLKPRVLDLVK